MNKTQFLGVFLASLAPLLAQQVTTSISALTPLTLQATAGAQGGQSTLPAGALAAQGSLYQVPLPGLVEAALDWAVVGAAHEVRVRIGHSLHAAVAPSSAATGSHEFLVEYAASAPVMATLAVEFGATQTAGVPTPGVGIDVGNDGTIELGIMYSSGFLVQIDPAAPLQVRFLFSASVQGVGVSNTVLSLVLTPENQTSVVQTAAGCSTAAYLAKPTPIFAARGLRFEVSSTNPFVVLVLGLAQQPVLLPTPAGGPWWAGPCLLMPSPDLILFAPSAIFDVPLPAALRPIIFHGQGVELAPTGLLTTAAWSVNAS